MGSALTGRSRFALDYSDNEQVTVADRLVEEMEQDLSRLDVATGYLSPEVWSILGHSLTKIRRFRLLLGKDYELENRRTRSSVEHEVATLVRWALTQDLQQTPLPTPQEAEAVRGFLAFLARPDAEVDVRVWPEGFLHAKAYILNATAGVGSANFTVPGLVHNRELVSWRSDRGVVRDLQEWFERNWERARPYKEELSRILADSRFGTREWKPYEVLVRVLADRYGTERPPSLERARFTLKWFQEDAVFRLIRLLQGPAGGALLADAVGLGKTYMAMGVIHHVLYQSREGRVGRSRPVVLICPASVRHIWERELASAGMDWACHILTVQSLREDFDVGPYLESDLVVVDEAHRLRGGGIWFRKTLEIASGGEAGNKKVLLLTATPVHTSLKDLTNLLRIITKNRRNVWAPEIADFEKYLERVEKQEADPFPLLDRSVVRRSRSDLLRAWQERRDAGMADEPLWLPQRRLSHVTYSYLAGGSDDLFQRFADTISHLELAIYDLDRFRIRPEAEAKQVTLPEFDSPNGENPSSLVGLYLAGLLKRFESSLRAVRRSLIRLDRVLQIAYRGLSDASPRLPDLQSSAFHQLLRRDLDGDDEETGDADALWDRFLATQVPLAEPEQYDMAAILRSIAHDRARVQHLLEHLPSEDNDGKVAALCALLTDPMRLGGKRTLVFSQFRDTARYLNERLRATPGLGRVELIDGGISGDQRKDITQWFDPNSGRAALMGQEEPRILVSTDVLAEGHNLQLAEAVVNFDLHWNPQVVVQRAGRVDRLYSPHKGVHIVSFLPDEGLDAHLGLVQALNRRFRLIHYLGLGDEPITKLSGDYQAFTFEQLRKIYRDDASVLDAIEQEWVLGSTDYMRQPLEAFMRTAGEKELAKIPVGVQSTKRLPAGWPHGPGVFVAFRLGASGEGESHWRFYPESGAPAVRDETQIFQAIVCRPGELPVPLEGDRAKEKGLLIDWSLLRRAAAEVAAEINTRRATAAVARGASERSRKLRLRIVQLANLTGLDSADLNDLLDRLEEVRVEDYDYLPGYRHFMEALRAVERTAAAAERSGMLEKAVTQGLTLLGRPRGEAEESRDVQPEDLTLVAWEWLLPDRRGTGATRPEQTQLELG